MQWFYIEGKAYSLTEYRKRRTAMKTKVKELPVEEEVVEETATPPDAEVEIDPSEETTTETELESLQNVYNEKFGKPVPNRFKNNEKWIKEKLEQI